MFDKLEKYIEQISFADERPIPDERNMDYLVDAHILAIKEIEGNLFSIPNDTRAIYIDRVLYYIFKDKMYLLDRSILDFRDVFDYLTEVHKGKHSVPFLDDEEKDYRIEVDLICLSFIKTTLRELRHLINSFGIKYNEEKYPIKEVLNISVPEVAKTVSKSRPQVRTQVIALEYIFAELGLGYDTANKTDIIRLIQLLTGNEYGKTPNNTNIKKLVWEDHSDVKGYDKSVDEIEELFRGVGLNNLAKKLRNSVVT